MSEHRQEHEHFKDGGWEAGVSTSMIADGMVLLTLEDVTATYFRHFTRDEWARFCAMIERFNKEGKQE